MLMNAYPTLVATGKPTPRLAMTPPTKAPARIERTYCVGVSSSTPSRRPLAGHTEAAPLVVSMRRAT
jgi:hypothetical protein